ncbi:CpsD/CapB family tyrosine-protein kinase [Parasphingorhabdus halotolerans]|uniref:CpsD/CapB family tyrosine-protein kinase n=1 Tax=Parasphingorhabdus halotolerans TaxID=2725558 RepID=A0A6H2DNJ0_9SPHN|nr:CpsD/CapB family tyrosine-protein kinase [Parasphingorhabdus halotolerans]QJB69758.1 CpsD/CapB family tyrosine-protein kinase [Parasphingorhabdus halotolerans]
MSSDRAKMLIQHLTQIYDHVIIDAPPVLGLADAPLLSRIVEGVVFVSEAEGVPIREIKTALARIQASHSHVFGVIVTKLQEVASGYGYGYHYGYGTRGDENPKDPYKT